MPCGDYSRREFTLCGVFMKELMQRLGYEFADAGLLKQALTHPSLGGDDNQRLEFLGDAVLEFVISRQLYRAYPQEREGGLTHRRALLVCEATLSGIAGALGVGSHLQMDKGEEKSQGRRKRSILADAMEAILAAVYLDGGMDAAALVVERHWPSAEAVSAVQSDHKSRLQEHLQAKGLPAPVYRVLKTEGPAHDRRFTSLVLIDGQPGSAGMGKTKKQSEQEAAMSALAALQAEEAQ